MRPGREIDARIAKEVFGFNVWAKNKVLFENAPQGDRPLRAYSKEIEWAFEVAKHMRVTLFPVAGDQWFAFIGPADVKGWESPQAMLEFLASGKFNDCGAAVGENAAAVICECALKAAEKRRAENVQPHADLHAVGHAEDGGGTMHHAPQQAAQPTQADMENASQAQLEAMSGMITTMANSLASALGKHEALHVVPSATAQAEEKELH